MTGRDERSRPANVHSLSRAVPFGSHRATQSVARTEARSAGPTPGTASAAAKRWPAAGVAFLIPALIVRFVLLLLRSSNTLHKVNFRLARECGPPARPACRARERGATEC